MFFRSACREAYSTYTIKVHEHETRGIPYLVGKGAVAIGAALRESNVRSGRGHGGQRESNSICTEFFGDINGVDHVALGFGHLLAISITNQRMDVNILERDIPLRMTSHKMAAQHDHARHPEK